MLTDTCYGNILVISDYCAPCKKAKTIIRKLIKEDYEVTIEDISKHPDIKVVPTLKMGSKRIVGLLSEAEYRRLLK